MKLIAFLNVRSSFLVLCRMKPSQPSGSWLEKPEIFGAASYGAMDGVDDVDTLW